MSCRLALTLLLTVSIAGCGGESDTVPSTKRISSPAEAGSGQPRLYTAPDGRLFMSWVSPIERERHALRYATRDGASWSDPRTVATGSDWFVNWADLPGVRPLPDGRLAAHFLESTGSSALAYAVRITQSAGDGRWHDVVTPHRDGTPTEHGFVSLLPWPDHRLLAVWLDGRKMSGSGHGQGSMTLRSAVMDSTGAVERRDVLDERTCECCATTAVRVGPEALIAYRDRSQGEIRDISLVRFDGQTWSEPTRLHQDGWEIDGCPVNGPALAADGERVVAAWFTAADGRPRVKVATSQDGGATFADPVVVAQGEAKGRVDVVLLDRGAAVSWLGERGQGGVVRLRGIRPDGSLGDPVTLASLASAGRDVGFPKLARQGEHAYAAWVGQTEEANATRVQTARVPLERIR